MSITYIEIVIIWTKYNMTCKTLQNRYTINEQLLDSGWVITDTIKRVISLNKGGRNHEAKMQD